LEEGGGGAKEKSASFLPLLVPTSLVHISTWLAVRECLDDKPEGIKKP
jgi:hypothetical protein